MTKNEVIESTRFLVENPLFVFIDDSKIRETAERFSRDKLIIPAWEMPVFLPGFGKEVVDFFILGNSINFAYRDFKTKERFETEYNGKSWSGAFGMWASLSRALDEGLPILDGRFLKHMSLELMNHIFRGRQPMPMMEERTAIFREVGEVLCIKYSNHFYNLIKDSNDRLYDEGKGMIERLVSEFTSFDDSVVYPNSGSTYNHVKFYKRAQLALGMLYGRFRNRDLFKIEDVEELTVFADYVVPKGLRDLGILNYGKSLAEKVDSLTPIRSGSLEELEIRASTIHACDRLIKQINIIKPEEKVNALHIDYKLWDETRSLEGKPHHLTRTTAY